ncbi:hypothetical protein [Photobacterium satsumensis]|uniref:hypothetical protein n=1 Tax=Photobacterium satsumensis TaxID=2910239 RepID=UPI003D138AC9
MKSVLIVNYNTAGDVIDLIKVLLSGCIKPNNIFVVDNLSTDNSVEILKREMKKLSLEGNRDYVNVKENEIIGLDSIGYIKESITLIEANENRGFAAGNNIVLKHLTKGNDNDYVWLLNPDTTPDKDALRELSSCEKDHKLAIIGAVILNGTRKIQCIGGSKLIKALGVPKGIGSGSDYKSIKDVKNKYNNKLSSIDFISGASMYFSVKTLKVIGLMPEDYFLYWEESDWCTSAKRKGINLLVNLNAIVCHEESKSVGLRSSFQYKIDMRNTLKYYKKYFKEYYILIILIKPFINLVSYIRKESSISIKPLLWSYLGIIGKI